MQAAEEKFNRKSSEISKQSHIIKEIDSNGDMQYNCTACRKVFRSRSQRYYHISCAQLQDPGFRCEYCEKSFARRTQWKYHKESHLSPVNKCDECQKVFSNPLALKKHLALHKTEPKVCPHCDKTFKKKISLDQHISAQHLNNLQYGCAYCNKKYASKSSLQLHLQTHESKRFKCTYCGKLFQRNSTLNLHLKRHNKTNSLICTVCQKTFSESSALARHSKLHQESVLQYYCKICDKSIIRKDNMTRHLTTIHPEERFEDIVRTIEPLQKSSQNSAKANNNFLIIENKLLREPFSIQKSLNILPQSLTTEKITENSAVTNQIKVITAVPHCSEIINKSSENISREFENHQQKTSKIFKSQRILQQIETEMAEKFEFIETENKLVECNDVDGETISFVNNNFEETFNLSEKLFEKEQIDNLPDKYEQKGTVTVLDNQQLSINNEPTIKPSFPSVIMSVGNVKKDLTSTALLTVKPTNPISTEYKHKKYCRNNYNIDLYRKILGCDEDDDDENIEKQQKFDHVLKSSTPVHWRKCFKNNYETSAS